MKKDVQTRFIVLILLLAGSFILSSKSKGLNNPKSDNNQNQSTDPKRNFTIPSEWKTYMNSENKITFRYPNSWIKLGDEANVINRHGLIMSVKSSFIDSVTHSKFFMEYHLAPYGLELFKNVQDDFQNSRGWYASGASQLIVAGNKAIETFSIMSSDIKGNIIDPPLKIVLVNFLDRLQTGEIEIQYHTPLQGSDSEVMKLNLLLSSINYTN